MSSLIKIAYNDIPHLAVSTIASNETTDHPHLNLFYGGSTIFWRSEFRSVTTILCNLAAGVTRQVDYLYLRNILPFLASSNFTARIEGTNDFISWTQVLNTGLVSAPNAGRLNEDYLYRLSSLSSPFNGWRVIFNAAAGAVIHQISKLYFGELFSFTRSPVYPFAKTNVEKGSSFASDSGALFVTASGRMQRNIELQWTHFSTSKREEFEMRIGNFMKNYPIVLVEDDTSDHNVLENKTCFGFANYTMFSPRWKDLHDIELRLTEDILG